MSAGVVEHPDSLNQAMLGRLAFLSLGAGVARVRIYDHTAAYRAVVADGQIPELIA